MIIDAHNHLPTGGYTGPAFERPGEVVVQTMQASGIDKAVILGISGWYRTSREINDLYAAEASRFPGILYPWAAVSPPNLVLDGKSEAMELRRAVTELGMGGLKLVRLRPGYMDILMEEVVHLGIPVLVHSGTPPDATPLQVANLARRYPTVKVILGHSGGADVLWPDALLAARQLDNIWLETSRASFNGLQKMVDTLGQERIVFGSDSPYVPSTVQYCLERVKALRISDQAREAILGGNMARLLGLTGEECIGRET